MAVLPVSLVLILSLCASVATARTAYLPCTEPVEVRFLSGPVSPLLVPESLPNGVQVVRVQIRFSRPVLVSFFSDFGRFDEWGGAKQRHVGRLPPISMVGNLASGDEVWEPMAQSYVGTSNDIIEITFQMLAGRKVTDVFFRPFHLFIAPNTIRSVVRGVGTERTLVTVPATVLGRYYMSHQKLLETDHAETVQLANPSLYCSQTHYRPIIQHEQLSESTKRVHIQLAEDEAMLEMTEDGNARVQLPVSVGGQGTGSFPLPKVVRASFGNQAVTVRLPTAQLEIQSRGRTFSIPLSVVTIAEQRERAFHQQPAEPYHKCWSGRRNNLSFLPVHHVLENSGEFHVYLPEKDHTHWAMIAGGTRAKVVQRGGPVSFSNWIMMQLEMPQEILNGIHKYVFLWPPPIPAGPVKRGVHVLKNEYVDFEASMDLDRAMFVPRNLVERTGCGSLNVTFDEFISQKDFCNTPVGSCVGLPLFSIKRFPIVPPFGLKELAGPYDTEFRIGRGTARFLKIWLAASRAVGNISVDGCTVLEPSLYQSLPEWTSDPPDREVLCREVWHFSPNIHTPQQELTSTLMATIDNFGQGGGNVSFTVKCSKLIDVIPSGGESFVWIEAGEKASVTFTLSGSRAVSLPLAEHKCQLGVSVIVGEGLPWSEVGKVMPSCTTALRTYHGAFKDPCTQPEQPLPTTKVDFHFLPQSELSKNEKRVLRSVANAGHSLVRALTLQMRVLEEEVELVYHLSEMSVDCLSQDVLILDRERLALAESGWKGEQEAGIGYQRDLLSQKRLFFFIKKQADPGAVTGCKVVVRANRPHVACPQPVVVLEKDVILTKADHAAFLQAHRVPFLQELFGDQPSAVLYTLVACALAVPLLLGGAGVGHILLFICRKKLPLKGELEQKKEQLKQAKLDEKRRWENPATYLEEGPQGPFYLLHNFRATAPLDSQDLKPVKMAGTLRYKDKELPVMFGHLKHVWVEPSGSAWVQASSGMYLLECEEAAEEYRAEHRALLVRQNPELDQLLPTLDGCHGDGDEGAAPGGENI